MTTVLLDTDILIDYTKGFGQQLDGVFEEKMGVGLELAVSGVTVVEFLADRLLRNKNKLKKAMEFVGQFRCVVPSRSICVLAGELLREGKSLATPDALIAATCIDRVFCLMTRNRKDFSRVKGIKFYEGKE